MRTRSWDEHVAPQLVATLSDGWTIRDGCLWRVAGSGHLAWRITRQSAHRGGYSFYAGIQPLYVVTDKLVGDLGFELGHGVRGANYYFPKAKDPQSVPVADIRLLFERFAVPHFEKYGRDLKSFVKLPTAFAKSRPQRRGTWNTEAWAAGAYSFLGDWKRARQSWLNCLLGLAQFDDDHEPILRKLAALGVDADDPQTCGAVVAWLEQNEAEMRRIWRLE
jgi:hypothetical protein